MFQPPPDVAAAFSAVHRRVLPGLLADMWARPALDGYSVLFTKAADGIRQVGAFSVPEDWRFDWERSYTRDEWLEQLLTGGAVSQLPPATVAELLAGIGTAIDRLGGGFTVRYTAVVVTAMRTAAA